MYTCQKGKSSGVLLNEVAAFQRCPLVEVSLYLLQSQLCPYYGGSTVQDCLLLSLWCPHCTGSTVALM